MSDALSDALTPPFVVASLVLCLAGALKLRSPQAAASALRTLGLPGRDWIVRAAAAAEVALGAACAVHPGRAVAVALALVYAQFAAIAAVLMRRRAACGCFGENDLPVSLAHVIASELLGTLAGAAAVAGPGGLGSVLARPVPQATVLLIGISGALYAVVLVYTWVPRAWGAWSGR
jgi:hypothetical protein